MGRVIDVQPHEFATVRAVLKLSQGEFAERLGLSRRTVIRGEQRGIELPGRYRHYYMQERGQAGQDDLRAQVREKWEAARKEARADRVRYLEAARSDTIAKILANVSPDEREHWERHLEVDFPRDTLSRDRVSPVTVSRRRPRKKVSQPKKRKAKRQKK
jgi:hypothetical protein